MKKILVMGLPGSGKTYFAERLKKYLESNNKTVKWFNADDVRKQYNDWDFSYEGRIRQSHRMYDLALENEDKDFVICDFVAPLTEMRNNFKADWIVWIDTIDQGRFEDTNKMFVPPEIYDFRITEQNAEKWTEFVREHLIDNRRRPIFDWKKDTVMQMGRFQPWHGGHRALFERLIQKTGQVCIMIRDCQGWNGSNPFTSEQVKEFIYRDLDPIYQGQYEIIVVPNIVHIGWGRDVGYTMQQEVFDDTIHSISATKIRKEMGIE
jgi:adenylylsulfate kinase